MSDPVSNAEIEDVLSSVRRLVSSDGRPEVAEQGGHRQETGKLVLTPSLRVSEDGEDQTKGTIDAAGIDPDKPLAFVLENPTDFGSDDQAGDDSEASKHDGHEDTDFSEEDQAHTGDDEALGEDAGASLTELEARVAEFEVAVAAREDQWEPDGLYEGDNAGGTVSALPWHDREAGDVKASEEDEVEAPSEAVSDDYKMSEGQVEDAEIVPKTDEDEEHDDDMSDENVFAEVGVTIDEAMLRDMVSDIVREELQGALGERITRNVRKLVRREIHRALTAHDLD